MPYGADMNDAAVQDRQKTAQSKSPFYVEITIDKNGNFKPDNSFNLRNGGIVHFILSPDYGYECQMTCSIPSKKDKPGGGTIVIGG